MYITILELQLMYGLPKSSRIINLYTVQYNYFLYTLPIGGGTDEILGAKTRITYLTSQYCRD